jgi:molybdopterin converting factor small subunit
MKIAVRYMAQIRQAAGVGGEAVELAAACGADELVTQLARGREPLRRLLLDADGRLHPTILLFVNDEQVPAWERTLLRDGDVVTVLSPVAGG